jgi:hypothetical protein
MPSSVLGNVSFWSFVTIITIPYCLVVNSAPSFVTIITYILQHLHERSLLHLRGSDLLQIEGWSHLGVHLTHHLGVVLILHQFVADLILLLSGVVTHLLAGDHYLHLGGGLLLHHEGIGHRCGNNCLNLFYKSKVLSLEVLMLFLQNRPSPRRGRGSPSPRRRSPGPPRRRWVSLSPSQIIVYVQCPAIR